MAGTSVDSLRPPSATEPLALAGLQLYVLKRRGKREKGDFGEVSIRVWLTEDVQSRGAVLEPVGMSDQGMLPAAATSAPGGATEGAPRTFTPGRGAKALPSVLQTAVGTLYEEPCVVFIR